MALKIEWRPTFGYSKDRITAATGEYSFHRVILMDNRNQQSSPFETVDYFSSHFSQPESKLVHSTLTTIASLTSSNWAMVFFVWMSSTFVHQVNKHSKIRHKQIAFNEISTFICYLHTKSKVKKHDNNRRTREKQRRKLRIARNSKNTVIKELPSLCFAEIQFRNIIAQQAHQKEEKKTNADQWFGFSVLRQWNEKLWQNDGKNRGG